MLHLLLVCWVPEGESIAGEEGVSIVGSHAEEQQTIHFKIWITFFVKTCGEHTCVEMDQLYITCSFSFTHVSRWSLMP